MKFFKSKWFSISGMVLAGIVIGIIFASNFNITPTGFASRNTVPVVLGSQSEPSKAILDLQATSKAFTAVSKELLPTVVSIATSQIVKSSSNDDTWPPFWKDFFGNPSRKSQPQRLQSLGSGVIVNKDGYILTNNHVVENADDITVTLYDNRRFNASVVGSDPLTEVAVIKVDGDDLPVARLGNSDKLEVGEWVLAIGNPLFLNSTVTAGIISAVGRDINIIQDESASDSGGSYAIENFIQTDAAINQGNSGGALVNLSAQVIGINTAIATRTGGYQGYGFAIPINLAKKIMTDLIDQGYVTRAWVGIGMRPVTEAIAERFKLDRPRGVIIDQIMTDSPAHKAGLKTLDIILKLDGEEVDRGNQVQNTIALKNPDDVVVFTILRAGKEVDVRVKLGQRETGKEQAEKPEEDMLQLGLRVTDLSDEIRSQLDLSVQDKGVVVTDVERYSAAADAGIQVRDLITRIEKQPIRRESDYRSAIKKFNKGDVVIFYLKRGNSEFHAFVKLPK